MKNRSLDTAPARTSHSRSTPAHGGVTRTYGAFLFATVSTLACVGLASCAKSSNGGGQDPAKKSPVTERLARQDDANAKGPSDSAKPGTGAATTRYLARFDSTAQAQAHAAEVRAAGGTVRTLGEDGHVLAVEASEDALTNVTIAESVPLARNARFTARRPSAALAGQAAGISVDEAFAVSEAVGLDRLRKRVKGADGRGLRVAVIDTGIDFGIPGLSLPNPTATGADKTKKKLAGYYDLTPFGRVTLTTLAAGETPALTFASVRSLAGAKITASGVLDERAQATSIFATDADFNGDGATGAKLLLARGTNAAGQAAVWIDLNGNGKIDAAAREEFTDFNSTGSFRAANREAREDGTTVTKGRVAVTLSSDSEIQVHSVNHMHGTGVATIVAGDGLLDGRLHGLAPKAELLSYVIDGAGNDGYTLETLIAMFLHARDQGADAVNASWGFATADLASARFLADTLDAELAAKGVLVAIAAGNSGPGIGTSMSDDYIPRWGFGLGAAVTSKQLQNVYGWTSDAKDSVVDYSSVGPTRGGRLIPDLTSPLVSLVKNSTDSARTYTPFSGTSSATPAFVGATTSLRSALVASGEKNIDIRLLKRALLSTAVPYAGVEGIRQGAGLVNVDAAFDAYIALARQARASAAGKPMGGLLPYTLSVSVQGNSNLAPALEGIRRIGAAGSERVKFAASWLEGYEPKVHGVDALADVVRVTHKSRWLRTRELMPVNLDKSNLDVAFDASLLAKPGVYTDVIELRREKDGTLLATVPVVVTIPQETGVRSSLGTIDTKLEAMSLLRHPFALASDSEVTFSGQLLFSNDSDTAEVGWVVTDMQGRTHASGSVDGLGATPVNFTTPSLPAGTYVLSFMNNASSTSPKASLRLSGRVGLPTVRVSASERMGDELALQLTLGEPLPASRKGWQASLEVESITSSVELVRTTVLGMDGYLSGPVPAAPGVKEQELEGVYGIALAQGLFAAGTSGVNEFATAVFDASLARVMMWGWATPAVKTALSLTMTDVAWPEEGDARIFAYNNIITKDSPRADRLVADVIAPAFSQDADGTWKKLVVAPTAAAVMADESDMNRVLVKMEMPTSLREHGFVGTLVLTSKDSDERIAAPVRVRPK